MSIFFIIIYLNTREKKLFQSIWLCVWILILCIFVSFIFPDRLNKLRQEEEKVRQRKKEEKKRRQEEEKLKKNLSTKEDQSIYIYIFFYIFSSL